ncbi:hypothetical protein [[Eubacterium] hominis]
MDEKNLHTEPVFDNEERNEEFFNNLFSFRNVLILTAVLGILLLIYLV